MFGPSLGLVLPLVGACAFVAALFVTFAADVLRLGCLWQVDALPCELD
jgi:hypothetical protein